MGVKDSHKHNKIFCFLLYFVVFMTVLHTHFYNVVDTQRGCYALKLHVSTYTQVIFRPSYTGESIKCYAWWDPIMLTHSLP